jgi:ABC-type transport system involved in multi-copper enzyme maturation permease subunit
MRQFWGVMQDSYREAMDGYVIYIMLLLATIVIILIASISYEPQPPEEALPTIVSQFTKFYTDRGRDNIVHLSDCQFSIANLQVTQENYQLRLQVSTALSENHQQKRQKSDSFRETVAMWLRPAKKSKRSFDFIDQNISLDSMAQASEQAQEAVQINDMEDFITNQFFIHAHLNAHVQYERMLDDIKGRHYSFNVTLPASYSVRGWPHTMKMFFGAVTVTRNSNLGTILYVIEDQIINGLGGAIALLIAVIITSFFIPNMLRKGSIDLLISKPIARMKLLVYKYIGGLLFILIISTFTIGGVWLVLAIRSGHWDPRFLIVIPLLTFTFAILYAWSTLIGVVLRSAIASLLLTLFLMLILYIVGQVKTSLDTISKQGVSDVPQWALHLVNTMNNVLPRYKDIDKLISKIIADGTLTYSDKNIFGLTIIEYPSWWSVFGISSLYIIILVGIACLWFSSRDY